jgi:hypothetical protein
MKSSVPISLGLLADEATYEITSLIVGLLQEPLYISVHVSMINSLQLYYAFNEGLAQSVTVFVSKNQFIIIIKVAQ